MQSAADYLETAKIIYSNPKPANTKVCRALLEKELPADRVPEHRKQALTLYAEVLCCDYLNRFNNAERDNIDLAQQALDAAAHIDPDYLWMHYTRGLMYRGRAEHQKSLECFERVLRLDPEISRAYTNMAAELLYVDRPIDALLALEEAIRRIPPDSHHYDMICWYRGRTFHYLRLWTDAIHWLQQSVERRPFTWFNRAYLISALISAGRHDEARHAVAAFREALPGWNIERIRASHGAYESAGMRRQQDTLFADLAQTDL